MPCKSYLSGPPCKSFPYGLPCKSLFFAGLAYSYVPRRSRIAPMFLAGLPTGETLSIPSHNVVPPFARSGDLRKHIPVLAGLPTGYALSHLDIVSITTRSVRSSPHRCLAVRSLPVWDPVHLECYPAMFSECSKGSWYGSIDPCSAHLSVMSRFSRRCTAVRSLPVWDACN